MKWRGCLLEESAGKEFVWLKEVMWKKQIDRRSPDSSEAETRQRWREQPGWVGKAHSLGPKVWVWPLWFN